MTEDDIEIIFEPRKAVTAGDIAEGIAKLAQEKLDIKNLRDMFAAKSMQGYCTVSDPKHQSSVPGQYESLVAKSAYAMADAMLRARETKEAK